MIDINLIPQALRKDGKGGSGSLGINLPADLLSGVIGGLVFLLLAVHLILGAIWLMEMGHLAFYQAQWQRLLPDKASIDNINKESTDATKQIKMISDMTVKKTVMWASKFNAISDALPKGLWIKKMTLDKTGLTIEGSAVSKSENGINNVGLFLAALRQDKDFMNDFASLEVNSIQGEKSNSIEVTDFSVMAKLKT